MRFKLADLIDIKHGYAFKGENFSETKTNIILLTPGNFLIGGGFNHKKEKYYSPNAEIPSQYILKEDDLLVAMTDLSKEGDILGYPALVPKSDDKVYLHNQRLGKIEIFRPDLIDKYYLYFLLRTKEYHNHVIATATGTTVKHTSPSRILSYEVNLPEINIQKRISTFLMNLERKIELNTQIISNLEQLAQTLFKRWFIDFEFPNEHGEPYRSSGGKMVESELGMIPEGWEVGTLEDFGRIVGGGTPSKKRKEYYCNNGIPWITPKDLSNNKSIYIYKGAIDITKEGLENSSARLLPKNTVLFSSRAPIGYVAIAGNEVATNQGFKSIVPHEHISSEYVYLLLKHLTPVIESNANGSTFKEISGAGMKSIKTYIPPNRVMREFHEIVSVLFEKIKICEKENNSLKELRDTLLPKLLSGEIELPDESEVTEDVVV